MYRIVRASILSYENYMKGTEARYGLIRPYLLLISRERFFGEKSAGTIDYLNLCDIISKMKQLYLTGEAKYHHFNMLLQELSVLGFDIDDIKASGVTDELKMKDQIDMLLQFLSFRYNFDAYDNQTGVHNIKTGEFIFVQP